jgi:hypothetical protein
MILTGPKRNFFYSAFAGTDILTHDIDEMISVEIQSNTFFAIENRISGSITFS